MKRYGFWLAALALVAAVGTFVYLQSDRRQIRRQLAGLAETASLTGTETDLERLARAARIGGFFTEDVVIRRTEDNSAFVGGRPAVTGMAAQASGAHQSMTVSVENVDIDVADATTATADMTVVVRTNSIDAESVDLREVSASLRKVNGAWLIAQAQVRPSREGQ